MKLVLTLITVIAAIVLISFGVDNISQPSNLEVGIGMAEIILGLIALYFPIRQLLKKL